MAVKHLIQNKLLDRIELSNTFLRVTYDGNNRASVSSTPETGTAVLASRHANETNARFIEDDRNGRDRTLRKSDWLFELRAKFICEVCVDDFLEEWRLSPLVLSREDTSSKQVTLFLDEAKITHPPQKTSSTGTQLLLTIRAELSRN
jgi:hypothetical protein